MVRDPWSLLNAIPHIRSAGGQTKRKGRMSTLGRLPEGWAGCQIFLPAEPNVPLRVYVPTAISSFYHGRRLGSLNGATALPQALTEEPLLIGRV